MKKLLTVTAIALFALAPAASAMPFFGTSDNCMIQKVEEGGTDNKVEEGGTDNKVEEGGTDNKVEEGGTDNKRLECHGLLSPFDWF